MLKIKKENKTAAWDYSGKDINLIPPVIIKQRRKTRILIYCIVIIVLVVVGVGLEMKIIQAETTSLNREAEMMEKTYERLTGIKEHQAILATLEQRIEKKNDILNLIEEENQSVLYLIQIIENELPEGILYYKIAVDSKESISVVGYADTAEDIAVLIHNLKAKNDFKQVAVEALLEKPIAFNGSSKEKKVYEFSLICSFGGDEDEIDQ